MEKHVSLGLKVFFIPLIVQFLCQSRPLSLLHTCTIHILSFVVVTLFHVAKDISRISIKDIIQYGWRSYFLGVVIVIGVQLGSFGDVWTPFSWYMCILAFFHYTEFAATALIKPESVNLDSYLLNHSLSYGLAALASWIEFLVEAYFYPGIKRYHWISFIGLLMCICGEIIRKGAMFTAGSNFDHLIRYRKEKGHQLVTSGIYSWCRHPSYVGWFYWSIGTQITLCNPACLVLYTMASWMFFRSRVYEEEITLLAFFGDQYEKYQLEVGTGLPFIKGYVGKEDAVKT